MNINKRDLQDVLDIVENIVDYHNKNLTKYQYERLSNAVELLKEVL